MKKTVIILACIASLLPGKIFAATFTLSPSAGSIGTGDTFDVAIKIDTSGASVNGAQATLTYPSRVLEAVKAVEQGSVFEFWLQDPIIDNAAGSVSFAAGSANGYSGGSLHVLKVTFRAKAAGEADLSILDGTITSNDGTGKNIFSVSPGTKVIASSVSAAATSVAATTTPPAVPPVTLIKRTPTPSETLPIKPAVSVPLYPDPEAWYNVSQIFTAKWPLPPDISNVATLLDKNPNSEPKKGEGLFDNKSFGALSDGIWYLHVQFANSAGWGKVFHYRIAVDTMPPASFIPAATPALKGESARLSLEYSTVDQLSGVDSYFIRTGSASPVKTTSTSMDLAPLGPGKTRISVVARDKAGNETSWTDEAEVAPLASPVLGEYSRTAYVAEGAFSVSGSSLPGSRISLEVRKESGEVVWGGNTIANEKGEWSMLVGYPFVSGKFSLAVVAKDAQDRMSYPVFSDTITAKLRPILVVGDMEITSEGLFLLFALTVLVAFAIGWNANRIMKAQKGNRIVIAQRDVANLLLTIRKDVEKALASFDDGKITDSEKESTEYLLKRIIATIEKLQGYVLKNIEEIEK